MREDRVMGGRMIGQSRKKMVSERASSRIHALIDEHAPYVLRVLRYAGVPEADVMDAAQEVYLVLHRRLPEWNEHSGALTTWLYGICIRVAANVRRGHHRRRWDLRAELPDSSIEPPQEVDFERADARKRLLALLDLLDDDKRAVFVLHEIEEMPMPEVAIALEIPLGTGYSRLRLARERLLSAARQEKARDDT
jgi:RNA polymerase sigma-70 factor (ECF subfamily)